MREHYPALMPAAPAKPLRAAPAAPARVVVPKKKANHQIKKNRGRPYKIYPEGTKPKRKYNRKPKCAIVK